MQGTHTNLQNISYRIRMQVSTVSLLRTPIDIRRACVTFIEKYVKCLWTVFCVEIEAHSWLALCHVVVTFSYVTNSFVSSYIPTYIQDI